MAINSVVVDWGLIIGHVVNIAVAAGERSMGTSNAVKF